MHQNTYEAADIGNIMISAAIKMSVTLTDI